MRGSVNFGNGSMPLPVENEIAEVAATVRRASIVAAAGCGKTEQIALATKASAGKRLILTHTHAGVDALKARMGKCGVPSSKHQIETIAGWSLRYAAAFPMRSCLRSTEPEKREEWNAVYESAARLLRSGAVRSVIAASYDGLFVDEYQDCTLPQHGVICALTDHLPACLFGDPLQAIFDFKGQTPVEWEEHVFPEFPLSGRLTTPWRWKKGGNYNLACWLHRSRQALENGEPLDLRGCPDCVKWHRLPPNLHTDASRNQRFAEILSACRDIQVGDGETLVVIGDSANMRSRSQLAKQLSKMRFSNIEPVSCGDMIEHAHNIQSAGNEERLAALLEFATSCMTGADKGGLLRAVVSRKSGGRSGKKKFGALIEHCLAVEEPGHYGALQSVLLGLYYRNDTYTYRSEMLFALCTAIKLVASGQCSTLPEAVWHVQNRMRHAGRRLRKRNIGSTLLVKGLEFDHAVITDAEALKRKDLYVGITRAIRSLTVLSSSPVIVPTP
jgi:DNA helicase-2/ATP-dependent DNA helicase PcrA